MYQVFQVIPIFNTKDNFDKKLDEKERESKA